MYEVILVGICYKGKKSLHCCSDNPLSQIDKHNYRCTPNIYFVEKTQLPKLVQLHVILLLGYSSLFVCISWLCAASYIQEDNFSSNESEPHDSLKVEILITWVLFFSNRGNFIEDYFYWRNFTIWFMNNPWTDVDFYKFSCYLKLFVYFIQTYHNLWVICVFFLVLLWFSTL